MTECHEGTSSETRGVLLTHSPEDKKSAARVAPRRAHVRTMASCDGSTIPTFAADVDHVMQSSTFGRTEDLTRQWHIDPRRDEERPKCDSLSRSGGMH
jgi:hypothetical protein